MFNSIEELEQQRSANMDPEEPDTFDEDDTEEPNDLAESINLLNQVYVLLAFFSDYELCKNITKRDRTTMSNIADKIAAFTQRAVDNIED